MQKKSFWRFTAAVAALTVLLALGIAALQKFTAFDLPNPQTYVSLLFFALLTLISFLLTAKSMNGDRFDFVKTAYITLAMRLFGTIAFLFFYLRREQMYSNAFILLLFGLYIFYTVLEIYFLTSKLHPDFKRDRSGNDKQIIN